MLGAGHHSLPATGVAALLAPPADGNFDDDELLGLPEPVARYLRHAIAPGAPLVRSARLRMRGHIRLGRRWVPFRAHQVENPHAGFVWAARAGGLIVGSDRYVDGVGGMEWKLAGVVPVVRAGGPDVSRSAAARAGAEGIWVPTALLPRFGVTWRALADDQIAAAYGCGSEPVDLHLRIGSDGRVLEVCFDRWGDPDETGTWAWVPFGGTFAAEHTFGPFTVPSAGELGWHVNTNRWPESAFFRYRLTNLDPTYRSA